MADVDSSEALRRSAETFTALVEQSPLGIYTVDADFRIKDVSAGARAVFRNVQPLIGRDFAEAIRLIWIEPFASEAIRLFRHTLETGEPYVSPGLTDMRKDLGTAESYEWQLNRVLLTDGRYGVVCYFFDSTRLQQAHQATRESEARFRALTDATAEVVYRMNRDWTEMRHLQGREFIADTIGPSQTWLERYIPRDDQPLVLATIQEAIRARRPFALEHRVFRVDGSLGWTYSRAVPILDGQGEIIEWFGAASDVTRRKEAETALRRSEALYRSIVTVLDEGVLVFDLRWRLRAFNPAAVRALQLPLRVLVLISSPADQPTLFALRDDTRPKEERTASGRYRQPSLFSD